MTQADPLRDDFGFWDRVAIGTDDECWPWTRARNTHGYGNVSIGALVARYGRSAHRIAWQLTNGDISSAQHVLHRCDNPPCCNPAHLFLGTHADNMRDGGAKGRIRPPVHLGAANSLARLSEDAVREIRSLLATGELSQSAIARRFGVGETTIRGIKTGKTWAWLR